MYRPHPAAAAVRAGTGQGIDPPSPGEQPGYRAQALDWLRAEFRHWKTLPAGPDGVNRLNARRALRLWLDLDDFAPVREPAELAKLPEAERREWAAFWAEVRAALDAPPARPRETAPPPRRR